MAGTEIRLRYESVAVDIASLNRWYVYIWRKMAYDKSENNA